MANNIKIISLNARGLRETKKRSNLFFWLKEKKIDICLLQETYWTTDIRNKLLKEWGTNLLMNFGTNHSKGTAILFNTKFNILNSHLSDDSRILLVNLKMEDDIFTIINIYAPNNMSDRKAFFFKIQKWIDKFAMNDQKLIIGGDFNFTEDSILDRSSVNTTKDCSSTSYKVLTSTKCLHDVWRQLNPNKKQFTYKDISRLDKILVSTDLLNNVQKSYISISGIKSDHKYISVDFNFNKSIRGPGRWKLNTSILSDRAYTMKIKHLLKHTRESYKNLSKQLLWEIIKVKIKEFSITYCKQKQKVKNNLMKELETKIQQKEDELIKSNYSKTIENERDSLAEELHNQVQKQNIGAQIRSRAKWVEQGEKGTKYFFNLEKENMAKNNIKALKRADGTYTKTETDIIEEGFSFYQTLYTKEETNIGDIEIYLESSNTTTVLNDMQKESLEGKITVIECEYALKSMKSNKSPGSDGLPAEFYNTFWPEIKKDLIESLNQSYDSGSLSPTQKRSMLSLLFKKNDKHLLKNWRPISLLNTDYKILAHILANRLKSVIGKLIHTDQNGYIKGRNIGYNIRLIQDVFEYFENDNIEGAILFLDFNKAFDTVDHNFLHTVLKKFNFGISFITWVKTMYNKAEACLTNNGWTSRPFEIQRGIRQGCPLSALLFLLVVEILANRIRNDKHNGLEIKVNGERKVIQLAQLADDTTLFLKNESAIDNCLKIVQEFGKYSGVKLNIEKTEGLWLGMGKNRNDNFADINWSKSSIKALGVYFGYDHKEIEDLNWKNKLQNIKKILNKWKYRDLTFQGRVLILKSLALAQVVYLVSSLTVPSWVINEINREFYSFIWKYKRDKISRRVLINNYESGGLQMIDFKSFCKAMKAVWASRLYKSKNETWSIIPNKYMEHCDINILMWMNINKEKELPINLPLFYREVIFSWSSCGGGSKAPQGLTEIRQQLIWGNKFILTKGKTLFYRNWYKSNIKFVDDLINQNGSLKSGEEIFHQLKGSDRTNWLIEFKTILKALPVSWKQVLNNIDMAVRIKKELKPFISVGNKLIFEVPDKAKTFYEFLISNLKEKPYIENYWDKIFPDNYSWREIWKNRIQLQENKKIAEFHFKLLHRILPSQENLNKWRLSNSDRCRFGCNEKGSYYHMFITCQRIRQLISKLETILKSIGFDIKIKYKFLLFGYKTIYPAYSTFNTFLSHFFFALYKYWMHDNTRVDVNAWTFSHLNLQKKIYKELEDIKKYKLFDDILKRWN